MRYVVLDTRDTRLAGEVAGHRGRVIGEFNTEKIAKTMALQRLAQGDRWVVVVDTDTGLVVFPFGADRCGQSHPGASGTRSLVSADRSQDRPESGVSGTHWPTSADDRGPASAGGSFRRSRRR